MAAESAPPPHMGGVQHVLLDIEGTICPISFVKDALFPYAIKALPAVLAAQWDDDAFTPYRDAFPEEHRASPGALQAHVEDLTKRDVKIAYHKNLQGYLWEDGYKSGAYATPLFADVAPQLKRWKDDGVQLAVYSSGSVFAQKLLFQHISVDAAAASKKRSAGEVADDDDDDDDAAAAGKAEELSPKRSRVTRSAAKKPPPPPDDGPGEPDGTEETRPPSGNHDVGDLTALISGWFDTTNAGLKADATSYANIVSALKWPSSSTLFLSDNVKEIDAATEAGLKAILVDRPGNAPVSEEDRNRLAVVDSLDTIALKPVSNELEPATEQDEPQLPGGNAGSVPTESS